MLELILLEIGIHPQASRRHDGQQFGAHRGVGAEMGAAVADDTVDGRPQFGIFQVQRGGVSFRDRPGERGGRLCFPGVDDIDLPLCREQRRALLVRFGEGLLVGGIRLLEGLNRGGSVRRQGFVPCLVVSGAHDLRLGRRHAGMRLSNDGELQLPRGIQVGHRRLLGRDGGLCLAHRSLVVAVVDSDQQISGTHGLVVGDGHGRDEAGHLRSDDGDIAADERIIGGFDEASHPPPVQRTVERNHNDQGSGGGRAEAVAPQEGGHEGGIAGRA